MFFVCQERFMICLTFARLQFSSGKKILLWFLHLVPISPSENHIVWIHIKPFYVSDHLNRCCPSSQENRRPPPPSFAAISQNKNPTHFKSPRLSSLYIGIYLFLDKEKRLCTNLRWCGENKKTDPASLRGVNGIYYVDFLHAVHINPQRCQHTSSYHV